MGNRSGIASTMVARSSSVQVIARSNKCQFPPLLMHVLKAPAVMPTIKWLAGIGPEVYLRECTLHSPLQNKWRRQNPLWLWSPEETSPEIQKKGTSGPKILRICPPKKATTSWCDMFQLRSNSGPHYVIRSTWGPVNMGKAVFKWTRVLLNCVWKSLTMLLNVLGSY